MSRELLFSVTKKDLEITFFRGSGNGGQNRNKRDTACRIVHRASGAVATAQEHRTQLRNKQAAFLRLTETREFKTWCRIESGRALFAQSAEVPIERQMAPENLLVEVWNGTSWEVEPT